MYRTVENPSLYKWNIFSKYSDDVAVGLTSRPGGVSSGSFGSFNQALHCGDETSAVIENRKRLCRSLNIDFENYTCAEQTHSANITVVDYSTRGRGRKEYSNSLRGTDALIVRDSNIMINIHLADCVPLAVYDHKKRIGALIHAGWKGTTGLISMKTVQHMIDQLHCDPGDMIAGIGPSIGMCCFEIGEETAGMIGDSFAYSPQVIAGDMNSFRADLKRANIEQLMQSGLKERNIEASDICTRCSADEFYSYRAADGITGRFSTFMCLKEKNE